MKKRVMFIILIMLSIFKTAFSIDMLLERISPIDGYDNGDLVEYRIILENNTDRIIDGNLSFPIGSIKSLLDIGGEDFVFSNIQNSATVTGENTSTGRFSITGNLEVENLQLDIGGSLVYIIRAKINNYVNENIDITAIFSSTEESISKNNVMSRVEYNYEVVKTPVLNYYEKGGEVIYDITIKNTGVYPIKNIEISDILEKEAFENSSIVGTSIGIGTNIGEFSNVGDLDVKGAIIGIGGTLNYRIIGQLNANYSKELNNIAYVTVRGDKKEIISNSISLVDYKYKLTKNSLNENGTYTPNGMVTYNIIIENTSSEITIKNMRLKDQISNVQALDIYGNLVPAFDLTKVNIVGVAGTKDSFIGIFDSNSELDIRDIIIAPKDKVIYTLKTYVKDNIVGEIKNIAIVIDNNGNVVEAMDNGLISNPSSITIEKSALSSELYFPGEQIKYLIRVKNLGEGIATGLNISDNVDKILSILANNGGASAEDIEKNPVVSWNVIASLGNNSVKSISPLIQNGGVLNNINLNDNNVVLYPNEEIDYVVTILTKGTSIGKITNIGEVENITSSADYIPQETLNTTSESITIKKSPNQGEYTPGGMIGYSIIVRNLDTKFANNVSIIDKISKIEALNVGGDLSPAIESWVLNFVSKTGDGTAQGEFKYGESKDGTEDLELLVDIAPGGQIIYTLFLKVKDNITGKIYDNNIDGNIEETGTGISMAPYKLELQKEVNETEYIPGKQVEYKVTVSNTGNGIAVNIPVQDIFSNIKTQLVTGVQGDAYIDTSVTATIYDEQGFINSSGPDDSGISSPLINKDLDTKAILSPKKKIVYKIVATINPLAQGRIVNTAKVNGELTSDKGVVTKTTNVSISKSVNRISYPNNLDSNGNKIEDEVIIYTISVQNSSESGIATNIPVKDSISTIKAELLDGGEAVLFKPNWTIKTQLNGVGTEISGNLVQDGQDIDTLVNIAPGGSVVFTITGTIDDSKIFYGSFSNSVIGGSRVSTATTTLKMPFLRIQKIASNSTYKGGDEIEYSIIVENIGTGYANNALITDNLSEVIDSLGNKVFSSWTINGISKGYGTTIGNFRDSENLNTEVDIAPGGSIVYKILAQSNINIEGVITNIATVHDVQNNNTSTASASIDNIENNQTIFVRKTTDLPIINPLNNFTYIINIYNPSLTNMKNIRIVDDLNILEGHIANLDGTSITDYKEKVFLSWEIYRDNVKISIGSNDKLDDLIENIESKERIEYKIVATPNPKLLIQKLKNTSYIYSENKLISSSFVETNVSGSTGGVIRSSNISKYIPGDTLIYTIKIMPNGSGYLNNYPVNEDINNLNVKLMNGNLGNIFFNPETGKNEFSVEFIENESKISQGTVPIPSTSIKNNTDLVGIVDVAQGDYLVYRIKGKIRPDILGDINYKSTTITSYRQNLTILKQVVDKNYTPGKPLTYTLKVENNSKGNAGQINLKDNLEKILVVNSSGEQIPAFIKDTIKISEIPIASGYGASAPIPSDPSNIDVLIDVPTGGHIQYQITGEVVNTATGKITNTLIVDGDTVSAEARAPQNRFITTKVIDKYLDIDGITKVNGGYVPGGYIQYIISVVNQSEGIIDDYPISDYLENITTKLATGGIGKAFVEWEIIGEKDSSEITNIGIFENNKNLDTKIDIGPNGYIKYIIKAKINPLAVGSFINSANINGVIKNSEIAVMAPEVIIHTKKVYDSAGINEINNYAPGDKIIYKIEIQNVGKGTAYGKNYSEILSSILANEAGNNLVKINPFENKWNIKTEKIGDITLTDTNLPKDNEDILINNMIIAPNGSVIFTIEAIIGKKIFGNIQNMSTYGQDIKSVILKSHLGDLQITNKIKTLDNTSFQAESRYKPGDNVTYEIILKNNGKGILNDLKVTDIFTEILTEEVGSLNLVQALENIHITGIVIDGNETFIESLSGDEDWKIEKNMDIGPSQSVTIQVSGTIKKTALGIITPNILNVDNKTFKSESILPEPAKLIGDKILINPIKEYVPGELVHYKLILSNKGKGYGNDIILRDLIGNIITETVGGNQGLAFSSWEIIYNTPVGGEFVQYTKLNGEIDSSRGLNTSIDIGPDVTINIDIKGILSENIVGKVSNTATLGEEDYTSEILNLKPANIDDILVIKEALSPTYAPDRNIGFRITIKNNSDTTINDLLLTDLISEITTEKSGGMVERALKPNWNIATTINGNSKNSVANIPISGDIKNAKVDIASKAEITVNISGVVSSNSLGIIKNKAQWSYNGYLSETDLIEVKSELGNLTITKTADVLKYIPGEVIEYTLKVKNNGNGFTNNAKIIDNLLKEEVELVDGTKGLAFSEAKLVSQTSLNQNTKLGSVNLVDGYLQNEADIYPGDTLTIKLSAKVNNAAYGVITNTAQTEIIGDKIEKASITLEAVEGVLSSEKIVDILNYKDGETLTYKLLLTNSGSGWLKNIVVFDKLSNIITRFVDGTINRAFENSQDMDLNTTINLAPNSQKILTVVGKLKSGTIGDIVNIANVNGEITNPAISSPLIGNLELSILSKEPYYIAGNGIEPSQKNIVNYIITLRNIGDAATDIVLNNEILNMEVKSNLQKVIKAFSSYKIISFTYPTGNNIELNTELNIENLDKNIEVKGSLESKGSIVLEIEAVLNESELEGPLGEINNLVTVKQGEKVNSAVAKILPSKGKANLIKEIKKIGGEQHTLDTKYKPKDQLVYEIVIENSGDGYLEKISLIDNVELMITDVAGNSMDKVFSNYTWNYESSSKRTVINNDDFQSNTSLNTTLTIAPQSSVVITLTGDISDRALGVIPSNTVTFGELSSSTPEILPEDGEMELTNKLLSENNYLPGERVVYEISLKNIGEGYLNDVSLRDILGDIKAMAVGGIKLPAFSEWTIFKDVKPVNGIVYTNNSYPNTNNLDDILDIEPQGIAVFKIEGIVNKNIYGEIENEAIAVNNGDIQTKSVVINSEKAILNIDNIPHKTTYSPGENIGFRITISNKSGAIAAGINIQNLIKNMLVKTVGGLDKFPFKEGYKITSSILGDSTNTLLNIPLTGDIKVNGDLGPNTICIIDITGVAIDDAVGDITNKITLEYDSIEDERIAIIRPNTGSISINKTSSMTEFTPGKILTYNIQVQNIGNGYATGVVIKDDLKLSEAFEIQNIIATSTSDILSKVHSLEVKEGIVSVIADIHPGESINIQIQALVLNTRIEPIINKVIATYLEGTFESTLTLSSVPGVLDIKKTQNSKYYEPENEFSYILTVTNEGDGWLKEVSIYDEIQDIQTQILGGGLGPAFNKDTIKASILNQGISSLQIINDKNLLVQGDIAPKTTVTITIAAQVSENAIGIISNIARATHNGIIYKSQEVIAVQQIPELTLKKRADTLDYEVGKLINYTISLTNNSINNSSGIKLKDLLSEVVVLDSKGNMVPAFKPNWKVSYESLTPQTIVSGVVEDGKDIDATIDIHSFDTVIFQIQAEVIDNSVGIIKNSVNANDTINFYETSFESLPKESEITITKVPQLEKYIPGELLTYDITVSNIGLGYGDNIVVQDILSDILVTTPTENINAFDMSSATIKVKNISSGIVTTIKDETRGIDLNDTLDMPPNSFITYEVSALVASNAIGSIKNVATAGGVTAENIISSENYKIAAKMIQEQTVYVPGKEVQFDLIVENIGLGYAYNIDVKETITNSLTLGVAGDKLKSFNSWTILKSASQDLVIIRSNNLSNTDIDEVVNIPPKGTVTYKVTATVNPELSGNIIVESDVLDSLNKEEFKNSVTFIPPEAILSLSKTSDKDSYDDEDEFVIYTLNIENKGIGNVNGIEVSDLISSLKGKNGNPLFTNWTVTVKENGTIANESILVKDNQDINNSLNLRSDGQNKIVYIITGKINKGIDDTITNIFTAKNPLTGKIDTASVTNYIKKIPDNEGELKVIKRALKKDIKIGEAVEYEIIVENNNESRFINVVLKDIIPPGFKYVKGTTELVESGADGILNTNDDLASISEPVLGNGLNFPSITMEPFTKFRVRYLLKPSIGVTFGKYKNQAYMTLNGNKISNIATATVSIIGDSLLDTASIIGKVFFDENGDGYQNEGEKGIPGVRLITPTGVIAITDRFGRYHVPDEWIYSKMGENYEIKLDITTLPENVEVLSENPQVKRVTPPRIK